MLARQRRGPAVQRAPRREALELHVVGRRLGVVAGDGAGAIGGFCCCCHGGALAFAEVSLFCVFSTSLLLVQVSGFRARVCVTYRCLGVGGVRCGMCECECMCE